MKVRDTLVLLTGGRGSGKTALCRSLAADGNFSRVRGLLSPGIFADSGEKTGCLVEILTDGSSRLLGSRTETLDGPVYRAWTFSRAGFERANAACLAFLDGSAACAYGLFILDEVGPLELIYGEGFRPVLDRLVAGPLQPTLLTVRPELAAELAALFPARSVRVFDAAGSGAVDQLRALFFT